MQLLVVQVENIQATEGFISSGRNIGVKAATPRALGWASTDIYMFRIFLFFGERSEHV